MKKACRLLAALVLLGSAVACGSDGSEQTAQTAAGGSEGTAASGSEQTAAESSEQTAAESSEQTAASAGGQSEAPAELMTMNVGDIKIASQADAYAAQQLGIFESHGLQVNFTYATSGQDIITAVQSGQLDAGLAIPGVAIVANASGFDLVGLVQDQTAHMEGPDTGGLVVQADSDITSLGDLEGRSIAVNATGANQVYVSVVETLRKAGVDVSAVSFQEIPFPQMGPVLQQGQVDAVATVDPFTTTLASSGEGRVISWYYVEALPGMPLSTYWAKRDWADGHPEEAEAFRAAMVEAGEYLTEHPDEARDLIAEFTGLDRALLDDMPLIEWNHEVSTDVWDSLIQLYVDAELIEDPIPVEDLLTEAAISGQAPE